MGEVYRATDTRLHRTVAIKLLLRDRDASPAAKRRFLQEARAASALNHPNIVVLHDIANHEGLDFLVMEHVPGQTLKDLIAEDGMPFESVVQLGAQVASALAAAHAAGIVHRDIKPANIMVTPDQQAKVLDFGVAKIASPVADPDAETRTFLEGTIPGLAVGTVSYMSPEQTRGETVDGRSDIFSLGCVLYQAATGRRPFGGPSTLAILHEIATGTPAAPSTVRAGLPRAFDQLIAACLAKSAQQRPASAAEVAQELKSLAGPTDRVVVRPPLDRRSVAVIPFRFRTSVTEDRFLSVALADAVASRLASNAKVLVRPMASVLKYAGTETDWTQVARDLSVDLVVEGTIQKMGQKIRAMAQVHRASDSQTLLSTRHDGDVDDLFGLQDRIADSVSEVFTPRKDVSSAEPAVPPTQNPLAYELYLRAIDRSALVNKFEIGSAIEMLNRATELDPNFADAWGLLAQAYAQMGMHLDSNPQWFERAEQAIARTLELDPVQCDALCARAQIVWSPSRRYQNRAALRALNAALKVNPSRIVARQIRGAILFHLGFYEQSERDCRETLLINPGYAMAAGAYGVMEVYRGDYEAANEWFERALALEPAQIITNIMYPIAPIFLGQFETARERIRKARQMVFDEPQLIALDGLISAYEGNLQHAEQLADDACSENRKSVTHTHHTWHHAAGVYALCGEADKAMVQLRRCAELGLPNHLLFTSDPSLRSLQNHPEFMGLMSDLRRQHDQFRAEFGLGEGDSGRLSVS